MNRGRQVNIFCTSSVHAWFWKGGLIALCQSLKGTLVFLHNPETPELLSIAIPTIVELVISGSQLFTSKGWQGCHRTTLS